MGSESLAEVEDFDYYNVDNLSEFITIMKSYPSATDASNMELLRKYRQGDEAARDLLIIYYNLFTSYCISSKKVHNA